MKLIWLRRDLRAVDNTALNYAINSGEPVIAVFVATPTQWQKHHMAPMQADFIYRRLFELQRELEVLNIPLLYREVGNYTQASQTVVDLAQQLNVDEVVVNRDYEINELARDLSARMLCGQSDINWSEFDDKCILAPRSVINKQGEHFKVFTPFKRAWLSQVTIPQIVSAKPAARHANPKQYAKELWGDQCVFSFTRISSEHWAVDFDSIRGQLRQFCRDRVENYQQERDFPARESTSSLSPYLAIGALSARQCMARLYAESYSGVLSEGAQTWLSELVWREFYQHLIVFRPDLCKSKDFVVWGSQLEWWDNPAAFERWKLGQTGFPIVDAAMRQLNQTGWMHNRLRMVVASFLTKDLHIDWRLGERYFMQMLVDGDYAANNGGWQWCASTGCDGQPYFRIFNPTSQGERFDPQGAFIRHWVPELASLSNQLIHTPWKSPAVNSLSYPAPMVDHKVEREITLRLYKEAKDN
ncbi:deoxyribodipyrimidine photo-lyase [Vibrio aestuarianus]|uniref:Deoxyribodipyrimidine photo-lyase n=1 Tax=Vibrio aestuarianus TaxID=28171 RepID=A0A9X4F9D2_9VIBR|nr:deoxyribodipyrimidine photo-lyase [Vibrio aestuarianus]MDE1234853.1 deoxyribodipyrimidine photo-lyase [Vibrio aestuarianus]MDE1245632.1 deoxyribodipyrimidine photo-lyase [Vibrio aestuarianus]MDE1328872.1 deoxyribodipyrimidine photo-lyase [Vibrio aestuarianus]MDE1345970.1 deoxyribodipyrimidine photo-lyase [Vibrio aestuarianus]NGZ62892.1 deoxyribodipyrimidine photo-lyase [Vibrio aestuarianus subsp. cardii]